MVMTTLGESLREVRRPIGSLVTPKFTNTIGNRNVRTLYTTGAAAQMAKGIREYRIDTLGISECRWIGAGRPRLIMKDTMLLHAGEEDVHQGGVALMLSQSAAKSLMEWSAVSSRIIIAWFHSKYKKISVIYVYAPTSEACDEDKDQFYEELQTVVDRCDRHDMVIITGYMNAKVGSDNEDMEQVMGKQGMGVRNNNGERLCEFCQMNGYVITGTLFSHQDIHKAT